MQSRNNVLLISGGLAYHSPPASFSGPPDSQRHHLPWGRGMVDVGYGNWASQSVTFDTHSRQVSLFPCEFLLRVSGPNPIVIPSYMFIVLTVFLPISIQFSVRTVPCLYVLFFFLFKIHLFFSWRKLLYRILLFSVKLQHESATGIHVCPRSWTSLPLPSPSHPSRLIHSSCLSFLKHTENSPWLSNLHPRLLSSMSISLFSISVSPLLTWK